MGKTKSTQPRAASLTSQRQAEMLGIGARYLRELRGRGLPLPGPRESVERWKVRAAKWLTANVQPKSRDGQGSREGDPDDPESQAHYTRRWRKARALREELALETELGKVHDIERCDSETVMRFSVLLSRFMRLPAEFYRTLANKPPEFVLEETERALRRTFDELAKDIERMTVDEAASALVKAQARGALAAAGRTDPASA